MQKLSKEDAARKLGVSLSTVNRWIQQGHLEVEHHMVGQQRRVVVLVDEADVHDDESSPTDPGVSQTISQEATHPAELENIALRERVRGLEGLVEVLREQNTLEQSRYSELYQALRDGTLALPEAKRDRPWWKIW